ncbi:MAG: 30S ribosomal protein S7 [Candidatus Aenigmatarchaeota archaeon]
MAEIKLFDKWSTEGIKVEDKGLKSYINLKPVVAPRSAGRQAHQQFHKSSMNIIERLMNRMFVPGHRGKKHLISSGIATGKSTTAWELMKETLELIEQRTKKNPIEVVVKAIENAALREEITGYQVGGIMVRKAVITAPQRRIDLALRLITQGSYQKSHGKGKKMADCLAEELIACYNYDSSKSNAIKEKERIEREAAGAR